MVKITGPLISQKAKGKLANTLLYQTLRGKNILRKLFKQKNPNTGAQQNARRCVYCAHLIYASLYDSERDNLIAHVKNIEPKMTAINWLVKICQLNQISKLNNL